MAIKKKTFNRLPHIDDETLDKIIKKLEEMRDESLEVVNIHRETDRKSTREDSDVGDDLDKASQDRDREFNMLMNERHLRRLKQVGDAFERIQDGTYGLCEGTDEPINRKRLMIMPLAKFTLDYQQQQEKMMGRAPDENIYDESASFDADDD